MTLYDRLDQRRGGHSRHVGRNVYPTAIGLDLLASHYCLGSIVTAFDQDIGPHES